MSFEIWMKKADAACLKLCGLRLDDLPDCCYRDWHEDGVSPTAAAKRAIRYAKGG